MGSFLVSTIKLGRVLALFFANVFWLVCLCLDLSSVSSSFCHILGYHTGQTATENVNTIDERRSKSLETEFRLPFVARLATNGKQTRFLEIFNLRSTTVKSVFDCHLSGVSILVLCRGHIPL